MKKANFKILCSSNSRLKMKRRHDKIQGKLINPLRPNNDLSQTSHCNIKGLSVSEVMRIESMITSVKFY